MIRLTLILAGWLVFLALGIWSGTETNVAPQVARPGLAELIKSFVTGFGVGSLLLTGLKLRKPGDVVVGMATFLVVALAMGALGDSVGIVLAAKTTHIIDHYGSIVVADPGLTSLGFLLSIPFSTWLAKRWPKDPKWN
jgi:hypothetical protein